MRRLPERSPNFELVDSRPSVQLMTTWPLFSYTYRRRDLWRLLRGKLRLTLLYSGPYDALSCTCQMRPDGRLDVDLTVSVPPSLQWVSLTIAPFTDNVHLGEN